MELRSSEELSPEESPEPSRKTVSELQVPSGYKVYSHTSRHPEPVPETSISASDPHLPRPLDRIDPSEKYSHYGGKPLDNRRTSYPVLLIKGEKSTPVFSLRELGPSKPSPRTLAPLNGPLVTPLSVPTRRVRYLTSQVRTFLIISVFLFRSDADPRHSKPIPEVPSESPPRSSLLSSKTYTPSSKLLSKQPVSTPPPNPGAPPENAGLSR